MAPAPQVVNFSDFDVALVNINKEPKVIGTGGKNVYVSYKTGSLYLQTPIARAPFGLGDYNGEKFSINISMSDPVFLEKIKELDSKIIDEAYAKSKSWFKQTFTTRDAVASLYKSPISYPADSKYDPTFRFNVPFRDNEFKCVAYTKPVDGEVTPMEISKETVFKGANVQAILQCSGIWIAGASFGCSFKLSQLLRHENDRTPVNYEFVVDSDEEEECSEDEK